MDALPLDISGFGVFSRVLQYFGIDVGQFVYVYFAMYSLYQTGCYVSCGIFGFVLAHFTSHVEIDDWNNLYNHLMDWASAHQMSKLSRELRAITFGRATAPVTDASRIHSNDLTSDERDTETDVGVPFNFQKWYGENLLIYKPNFRTRYFCHGGIVFHW